MLSPMYRVHPEVVSLRRPDGSLRLLHLGGNICALDPEATSLFDAILDNGAEVAAWELSARHPEGERAAERDVSDFVAQLLQQRLIRPRDDRPRRRDRMAQSAAAWTLEAATRALGLNPLALRTRALRAAESKAEGAALTATLGRLLWTARASIARFGWYRTLTAWQKLYPQPTLPGEADSELLSTVDHAVRAAASRSLFGVECKERGLSSLAVLRASGLRADLIIGVTHDPLQGHVWAESQGRVVSDDPEHCLPFREVARFG